MNIETETELEIMLRNIKTEILHQQVLLEEVSYNKNTEEANEEGRRIMSVIKQLDIKMAKIQEKIQHNRFVNEGRTYFTALDKIAEKNNCLRVRFLDWMATKLEKAAAQLREYAFKITTPCVLKIPAKNKTSRYKGKSITKEHAEAAAVWQAEFKKLTTQLNESASPVEQSDLKKK